MSKRTREWERRKRQLIKNADVDDRKWLREILDEMPPPTPETVKRIDEIRKAVEAVFGKEPRRGKK